MEESFMLYLRTHPTLVKGILKSCGLKSYQENYEDYFQEAQLILWQLWQKHLQDLAIFEKVAFTYTRCRILDFIRRDLFIQQVTERMPETLDLPYEEEEELVLQTFLATLSPFERSLCLALSEFENLAQVASHLKVSRNRIYRQLPKLQEKVKNFFK